MIIFNFFFVVVNRYTLLGRLMIHQPCSCCCTQKPSKSCSCFFLEFVFIRTIWVYIPCTCLIIKCCFHDNFTGFFIDDGGNGIIQYYFVSFLDYFSGIYQGIWHVWEYLDIRRVWWTRSCLNNDSYYYSNNDNSLYRIEY